MSQVSFRAIADRDLTQILWNLCAQDADAYSQLESSARNVAEWDQRAMAIKDTLRTHFLIDLDDPVHAYVFVVATSMLQMPPDSMDVQGYLSWARGTIGALRTIARTASDRLAESALTPESRCVTADAHEAIEAGLVGKPHAQTDPPPIAGLG